jgi:MoaA/NifB/PqqE/SkfB family radical SAM enzyme/predicted DNA-binding WGR domain protein
MRWTALDGGLPGFDRARGLNVLIADEHTAAVRRRAPRSLQIGLLTPCNLSCSFCYRDRKAPSRLDRAFLVELLQQCDRWGVLEVAFGGGEPLLFDGFAELVEELHATTGLGINVTTNGMFLDRALVQRLRGKVGEWRVSIYPENHWPATLARLAGESIGVNWIVTPANVHEVEARVRDFRARGARNVLLLGYKGDDPSLLLDEAGLQALRAQLARLEDDRIRLDICWYPRFPDLPHLFARTDCGAGDDILVITADRAVQACSFADHRVPFETFAELQTIYRTMRVARPVANTGGCTRELFTIDTRRHVSGRVLDGDGVWTWHARASSNSGAYTLLARFRTEDRAREAEAELDDAYQAHLDFVLTEEGQARDDYYGPTAPLVELATKYGFEWPADDGFAWEGDSFGDREEADALEIERLGKHLVVHLGYGQQIGGRGISQLCAALGADTVVNENDPFHFVVTATTSKAAADAQRAVAAVDVEVAEDEDDEGTYRIDCVNSKGETEALRFPGTIGGVNDSAKVLLALARVKGLTFELRTAASPVVATDDDDGGDMPPVMLADDTKQRFWEVSIRTSGGVFEVLSRFGKIGAAGQTRVKTFTTGADARAAVEAMIAEKQKQGFR